MFRVLSRSVVGCSIVASGTVLYIDRNTARCNSPNQFYSNDPKETSVMDYWGKVRSFVGHLWTETPHVIALPTDKLKCQWDKAGPPHRPVVLVTCGSFNPPTLMHTRMLDIARDKLLQEGYDVLGSYLSPVNDAYWKKNLVPAVHRVSMCQLATASSTHIMVDAWEAQQKAYIRTLHVLEQVSHRLSEQLSDNTIRVMLVCGADVLESMADPAVWKQDLLERLLKQHGVVCISRNGAGVDAAGVVLQPGTLLEKYRDNIIIVEDVVPNMVSSSLVRSELEQGKSVKYLIDDAVMDYIRKHKLYGVATS